jgi:hypothetical protein
MRPEKLTDHKRGPLYRWGGSDFVGRLFTGLRVPPQAGQRDAIWRGVHTAAEIIALRAIRRPVNPPRRTA